MGFSSGFGVGQVSPKGERVKADTGSPPIHELIEWLRARKEIMPVSIPLSIFRIDPRIASYKKYETCARVSMRIAVLLTSRRANRGRSRFVAASAGPTRHPRFIRFRVSREYENLIRQIR